MTSCLFVLALWRKGPSFIAITLNFLGIWRSSLLPKIHRVFLVISVSFVFIQRNHFPQHKRTYQSLPLQIVTYLPHWRGCQLQSIVLGGWGPPSCTVDHRSRQRRFSHAVWVIHLTGWPGRHPSRFICHKHCSASRKKTKTEHHQPK